MKNKILLLSSMSLLSTLARAEEDLVRQHAQRLTESAELKRGQSILDTYFAPQSTLQKMDIENPSLANSDIAIHLFQVGPEAEEKAQTLFPEFNMRVGDNCEKEMPFEFATRLERDENQQLKIAQVSVLVGPSYQFKSRIDVNTGRPKFNLTDTIVGNLGLTSQDAGSMSLNFSSPRLRKLIESGRVNIRPVLNANGKIQSYNVSSGGKVTSSVPDLNSEGRIAVRDPDSGETHYAILMPYATFFAPRKAGFLESRTWGKLAPTGTAIHGADIDHLAPRSAEGNKGSAGCARVQNEFAQETFAAISKHLQSNGARPALGGSVLDVLESDNMKNGSLSSQKIIENSDNIANLEAFLASRQKISMIGFAPQTPAQMKDYYSRAFDWQLKNCLTTKMETSNLGPLGPLFDAHYNLHSEVKSLEAAYMRGPRDRETFDQINSGRARLKQIKAQIEAVGLDSVDPKIPRSQLDPKIQKLFSIKGKYMELIKKYGEKSALDNLPIQGMTPEVANYYNAPLNKADLYEKSAVAMENFYRNFYRGQVPQLCLDQVKEYRQRAIDMKAGRPLRATAVRR